MTELLNTEVARSNRAQTVQGFTIVELLIVIVVIAILAAISVVTFTQVQMRAHDARVRSEVGLMARQLELFRIDAGEYPTHAADLRLVVEFAGLSDALRAPGWTYAYCSDGTWFAILPDNDTIDLHPRPVEPGALWRVFDSRAGWGEVAFDANADPNSSTVNRDLCAAALPPDSRIPVWAGWFHN